MRMSSILAPTSRNCLTAASRRRPSSGGVRAQTFNFDRGEMKMYAITGITGKVGGALARTLLADGQPVRAVVRDTDKGRAWAERGCSVALAEMQDAASLS